MINNVVMVGRLTRDIDLKYTGSGIAVASFTVAMDRPFTSKSGEKETDFVNCVAWRKTAENAANFVGKGSLVGIKGRIQTRNYEKDGNRVYVTEVVVDNFAFLESKKNNIGGSSDSYVKAADPFQQMGSPIDISDDDMPF